jgi:hypothetical protein
MAGELTRVEARGPSILRGMDQRFGRDRDPEAADEILNMLPRFDGMLQGVRGNTKFHAEDQLSAGKAHGLWGGVLEGREEWLTHVGQGLYRWSKTSWTSLTLALPDEKKFGPTIFVAVPGGVVVLPRVSRGALPHIYDGDRFEPLGYSTTPGTPEPVGPYSKDPSTNSTRNNEGYDLDFYKMNDSAEWPIGPDIGLFGYGKIGTTSSTVDSGTATGSGSGVLYAGEWTARVQFIDRRGDLSPPSPLSAPIHMDMKLPPTGGVPDMIRMQFAWRVPQGDARTMGRVLSRTRDMRNSPTGALTYEIRPYAGSVGIGAFATIPDNVCTFFPDNFSDGELLTRTETVAPMPASTAYAFLLGRSWFGTDRGLVWFSQKGRLGTVLQNDFFTVVGRVQAIVAHVQGLLVLTDEQAVFVQERPEASAFVPRALHGVPGCAAGASAQTLTDGSVIWLAPTGFIRLMPDGGMEAVGHKVERSLKTTMLGRWSEAAAVVDHEVQQYTCWVPRENSDLGFVYTLGFGWSLRSDAKEVKGALAYRGRIFVSGQGRASDTTKVFVLDDDRYSDLGVPPGLVHIVRTSWVNFGEQYRTAPQAVAFESEGFMSSSVAVQTLRNGALGAAPAADLVKLRSTTDEEGRTTWSEISASGYWESPGNFTVKGSLFSSGATQSFAVQLYSTQPMVIGWIRIHENKNGNSRGAP